MDSHFGCWDGDCQRAGSRLGEKPLQSRKPRRFLKQENNGRLSHDGFLLTTSNKITCSSSRLLARFGMRLSLRKSDTSPSHVQDRCKRWRSVLSRQLDLLDPSKGSHRCDCPLLLPVLLCHLLFAIVLVRHRRPCCHHNQFD